MGDASNGSRSQQSHLSRFVRQSGDETEIVIGFVLRVTATWVLLARVSDSIELDGWSLLRRPRWRRGEEPEPEESAFVVRVLRARTQWPPAPPPGSTGGAWPGGVIQHVLADRRMLAVYTTEMDVDECLIGLVARFDRQAMGLDLVGTSGLMRNEQETFRWADIVRLDFGGRYEEALELSVRHHP